MKVIVVEFLDTVDVSALGVNSPVAVVKGGVSVTGGTVTMTSLVQNPPSPASATLIPHTHTFDAPGAVTGPAVVI